MFLQKQSVLSVTQTLDRYYTHTHIHTHQSVSQHFLEMQVPTNAKDEMLDINMRNKPEHKHIIQKYNSNFLSILSNSVSSQTMMNEFPYAEREMVQHGYVSLPFPFHNVPGKKEKRVKFYLNKGDENESGDFIMSLRVWARFLTHIYMSNPQINRHLISHTVSRQKLIIPLMVLCRFSGSTTTKSGISVLCPSSIAFGTTKMHFRSESDFFVCVL